VRVEAYSGDVFLLPQAGKPKHGLRLTVDTRGVDGNGYRPVRIEAAIWPPGPALADRTIRIVVEPDSPYAARPVIRVSGPLEIPEGALQGQMILAIPQSDLWTSIRILTYEDGDLLDDLSERVTHFNGPYEDHTEAIPSILIVDCDAPTRGELKQLLRQPAAGASPAAAAGPRQLPDVRRLPTLFLLWNPNDTSQPQVPTDAQLDDLATLRLVKDMGRVELWPPSELPARWLDYSCFDIAFVSRADLQSLATGQPAAWQAFRDWVASGTTLCVYGMDLTDERLADMDGLLGIQDVAGPDRKADASTPWRPGNRKQISDCVSALEERRKRYVEAAEQARLASGGMGEPEAKPKPPAPAPRKRIEPQPFATRPFYRGRIVAMQTAEPLAADTDDAAWLFNDLGESTWMWYQRHGMSLHRENNDYWDWLVPGTGRAPVGSFLILIAAFVIVIGPVNYFLLRRKRRLYLLLVTVPLGAAIVTLTLFAYALVRDGLGVRVRVRSFTEIDQRAGREVSWSRQSYYAGLAPSGGLTLPATAAVFPIERYPTERFQGGGQRWLVWGDAQTLASGYISSRSTTQFLVVESGPNRRELSFDYEPDAAAVWATNRLGATIDRLVVKDSAGRVLGTTQLAAGQRCRLDAIEPGAARLALAQAVGASAPAFPPGYHPGFDLAGLGGYNYWSSCDYDLPGPTMDAGILEQSLVISLNAQIENWPPRTYIAVTRTTPGVSLGCDDAREEASFHAVLGRW